jgi:hypothetical protein
LILDPVAVACALRALLQQLPALLAEGEAEVNVGSSPLDPGAIATVAGLATGTSVHVIDPFGNPWEDVPGIGLALGTGITPPRLTDAGPHAWADGASVRATAADAGLLRWGLATTATLGTTPLARPTLPPGVTLPRDFFRVVAADLGLHLRGNRGAAAALGVPGVDALTQAEPLPEVVDGSSVAVTRDGQATLGAVHALRTAFAEVRLVSPVIDDAFDLPPGPGARWPDFPAPAGARQPLDAPAVGQLRTQATAAWVGATKDVVVTFPAGLLPTEAHVRAFNRRFVSGVPLSDSPTTLRGDGAAAVVGSGDVQLLLRDPLGLGDSVRPDEGRLRFDLLVVPRPETGPPRVRLFGGFDLPIADGGTAPPAPPSAGRTLAAVPAGVRGICPAPILGLPPTAPAGGPLTQVLAALGEAEPREAPRYPTMARTETIAAGHGANPTDFGAVISGGFLAPRALRGDARLGNPGVPAGPEDHAPGLSASGALGRALYRAAMRRTKHVAPRLIELNDSRFHGDLVGPGTVAASVLQTIAPVCENPELALLPSPVGLPTTWDALKNAIVAELPSWASRFAGHIPAPGAGDVWVTEVLREAFAAKQGRRDAQWAWRWALSRARQLVYIETPLFGRTGSGGGADAVDLVEVLVDRLAEVPTLRVVVSLPKEIAFGPGYEGWAKRFYEARNAAVDALVGAAGTSGRVQVYHPIGFPGRPELLRTTIGVVDDVWAIVGASTFSRRGMTFDGGVDVALLDRQLVDGASAVIRALRREAMARTAGLAAPAPGETPAAGWVRLGTPAGAFEHIRELLRNGGQGLVEPFWRGPSEPLAQTESLADPEGRDFDGLLGGAAAILAELGAARV